MSICARWPSAPGTRATPLPRSPVPAALSLPELGLSGLVLALGLGGPQQWLSPGREAGKEAWGPVGEYCFRLGGPFPAQRVWNTFAEAIHICWDTMRG